MISSFQSGCSQKLSFAGPFRAIKKSRDDVKEAKPHELESTAPAESLSDCVTDRMMFILCAITASHFTAPPLPLRFKAQVGDSSKARWQKSPTAAELRFAPSSSHLCIANCPIPSLPITAALDLQNENQSYGGIAYRANFFHQLSGRDAACLGLT